MRRAKKDAIKISVMMDAVKELEAKEFIFLTLTAPNCTGEELAAEIDRFNKACQFIISKKKCTTCCERVHSKDGSNDGSGKENYTESIQA